MSRLLSFLLFLTFTGCAASDEAGDPAGDGNGPDAMGDRGCDQAVTECALGALSRDQFADYCDLVLASIAAEPGDRFECMQSGLFLDITTREQCLATTVPSTCSVTVGESISCYKAAEVDACEAFDDACAFVTDPETGCGG